MMQHSSRRKHSNTSRLNSYTNFSISAAEEIARLERNIGRHDARQRAKGIAASPSAANSPMADGDDGTDSAAPSGPGKKSRKKQNTEGTGRRCANCGQIGHIKTNKKSVSQVSSLTSDYVCDMCNASSMGTGFDAAATRPGTGTATETAASRGNGRKARTIDFDKAVGRKRKRVGEVDAVAGAAK